MLLILHNSRFRRVWLNAITNDMALMVFFTVNGWLALSITDSAFWTGVTAGMGGIGLMTTSLFAGVLVDRMDRRMLIIASQLAQAVHQDTGEQAGHHQPNAAHAGRDARPERGIRDGQGEPSVDREEDHQRHVVGDRVQPYEPKTCVLQD